MMRKNLIPSTILAILFLVFSCQREIYNIPGAGNVIPTPDTPVNNLPKPPGVPSDNLIPTSLQGRVLDENNQPLNDAEVSAGGKISYTDQYGVFRITDIVVPEHATFVKVNKPGYFLGNRTLISRIGGNGFVKIKMLPKKLAASFNASGGALVEINTLASVQFQPNSIVTTSGQRYSGKVQVYGAVLDPTAADFTEIMPGDLRGINADSQFTALKSFGMTIVSLETESGEQLQLVKGKTAVISMKIPSTMLSEAPLEIPLWHFSEVDGMWREEGKASLQNGKYIGNVSHFSVWNYDAPMDFVLVSLRVRGFKGRILPYTHVRVTDTRTSWYSDAYTDSTGYLSAWFPIEAPLIIDVLNDCGGLLFSKSLTPLSQDTDLGDLFIPGVQMITVKGTVTDCNGQPAMSGNANLFHRGLNYTTPIIDGEFYISINKCDASHVETELYISDPENHYKSESKFLKIIDQDVDAGNISNCNSTLTEYAFFKLGSDSIRMESPPATIIYDAFIGDTATKIYFKQGIYDVGITFITIEFYDTTVHTSKMEHPYPLQFWGAAYSSDVPLIVNVKKFGKIGEEIYLTFSGMYKNLETGQSDPLTGEMRLTRRK